MGKIAAAEEGLKALRLDAARSIEDSSIRGMLDEPSRELWDHDTCAAVEISERAEPETSQEVSLEVGALVAASCAGGAQELSSSVLQAWAAGFLSPCKKGLEATPYGKVRGSLWESGPNRTLSLGSVAAEVADADWMSWVFNQDGAVTPGHQGTPFKGRPAPLEY